MATTETQGELITRLENAFDTHVGPQVDARPFALLDFPDHANVGDSAIWLGETEYFRRRLGRTPAYVSTMGSFDGAAMAKRVPDGVIFLHGGGNFGDVWPHHQRFRERIIERFPDHKIVQLPQSIHYSDEAGIATTARVIEQHRDFLLLVRDQPSYDLAVRRFQCPVQLCPDAAFAMGARQPESPMRDVLAMLRTDSERTVRLNEAESSAVTIDDWLEEDRATVRRAKMRGVVTAGLRLQPGAARFFAYEAAADLRVARGLKQLAQARAIITDRLHVHILSLLLGRPHAVLDNSYGKIARFMDAFSGTTALTHRATSFAEALDWARQAAEGRG